ncbi:uncharacterized protein BKA55DRAFT_356627 [Fusarium redolens]|uniref:Uncharacterized protein n=1 Tax=Fusarium redolens TaxID=48865 RepID=A0A9P9KEC9_FUSRE|nr:uncharacterized protein BKA55DRAFT_356627 [Fusarium redolens]KAH7254261.1 hypothetical protein BKA55DRAFT_356627 [Fusarium redolens]
MYSLQARAVCTETFAIPVQSIFDLQHGRPKASESFHSLPSSVHPRRLDEPIQLTMSVVCPLLRILHQRPSLTVNGNFPSAVRRRLRTIPTFRAIEPRFGNLMTLQPSPHIQRQRTSTPRSNDGHLALTVHQHVRWKSMSTSHAPFRITTSCAHNRGYHGIPPTTHALGHQAPENKVRLSDLHSIICT